MTEQKQDLRVVRTKEAIRSAFKALVCELPYEKVTVKAIADRANINRNTFYLHYETTDDVLREIQAEHSEIREGMHTTLLEGGMSGFRKL